jgi:hypothetical protein
MEDEQTLRQLLVLKRQYFQLVEPSQLRWPHTDVLKVPDVQSWIFANLFDPAKIQFPPLERYQLRVLKVLISKLEKAIDDPEQDVRNQSPHPGSYALHFIYNDPHCTSRHNITASHCCDHATY